MATAIEAREGIEAEPRILAEIVDRILSVGSPQRIILFGSRARGEARVDSDYDILVVEDSELPRWDRSRKYLRALRDLDASKDIVVWTPEEIAEWSGVRHCFVTAAIREGRLLYHEK